MRFIASALLLFTLAACNAPEETETTAALEPVAMEEAASTEEVSSQACVKRCSGGLYSGQGCYHDASCLKTCSGGLYNGQGCYHDASCGKTCSGGSNSGMACSTDPNCPNGRCITNLCASHRCVTYCN